MKVVVDDLESQGFTIIGAEDVLANLGAPGGNFGAHEADAADWADIRRGMAIVAELGRLDIGQAVVVRDGYVLAVEAAEVVWDLDGGLGQGFYGRVLQVLNQRTFIAVQVPCAGL